MRKARLLSQLLAVLFVAWQHRIEARARLFDYGEKHGDQLIHFASKWSGVTVEIPIMYMERSEQELFIATNGIVTFQELDSDEVYPLDKLNRSAIAVLYSPASDGRTFYRTTTDDLGLLRRLSDSIRHEFAEAADFAALQAVVVTWEGVRGKEKQHGENTFQLVIVSDGVSSYAFVLYGKIAWAKAKGHYAQAGFTNFDGRFQGTINSGTESIKELADLSNMSQDGIFIFRISGQAIEDPRENEEYGDYEEDGPGDYAEEDGHPEEQKGKDCPPNPYPDGECPVDCQLIHDDDGCVMCVCAQSSDDRRRRPPLEVVAPPEETKQFLDQEMPQEMNDDEEEDEEEMEQEVDEVAASPELNPSPTPTEQHDGSQCNACHAQASCGEGRCCMCRSDHFGNGVECLKREDPQRISGSFHGTLNRQDIEKTELHTYITTSDGKTYTAVSNIPENIGYSFLLLYPIGSVMGFLFAESSAPSAKNGFDLTGGLFNRTASVHFDGRYAVTVEQTFSGRDIHHYLKADVGINGILPTLSAGAKVTFANHEAEYRRETPGHIRAYTSVDIMVSEEATAERKMRMIVDEQIMYRECQYAESLPQAIRVKVENIQVTYEKRDGVVRYASANAVNMLPTRIGMNLESTASRRQHGEPQFQPEAPVPAPTHSNTDPCAEGAHLCTLPNMICRAHDHKYRCECEKGYQAKQDAASQIGWICVASESVPSIPESALPAGHCTQHNQCHQWGECAFQQGHTVGVCRCRGWYVGDGVSHCGPPDAVPDQRHEERQEQHNPETLDEEEEGRRRQAQYNANIPQHNGRPCGSYICSPNAECMPSPDGDSECVCRSGFHGNGLVCESLMGDSEGEDTPPQWGTIGTVCRAHEDCHEHATCAYSATVGYYTCECQPPYQGDGMSCTQPGEVIIPTGQTDVHPGCDINNDCSQHADCVFERTPEGADHFKCVCRSGYFGDGWRCTQIDLSGGGLPLPPVRNQGCDTLRNCHHDAQCVFDSHNDRYACECRPGFNGDGYNCVKTAEEIEQVEEVEEDRAHYCRDTSDCHANGHCVSDDVTGGYVCECLPGHDGDGVTSCIFADKCSPTDRASCAQNAECVYGQQERAYICKCVQGFTGDGVSCVPHAPVSTCRENPRLCHANAQCVHDREHNTHICMCRPGSVGDGYQQCTPVESPRCGNCSSHAHCASNQQTGGWSCVCNTGYQGNGHVCAPFATCLDDRSICDSHAECVPGEGGHYVCSCLYGYHGNGRSCSPDSNRDGDELLIARGMAIYKRGVHADAPGKQLVIVPGQLAVGVDFDCVDERIAWSDISGHTLRTSALNGSDTKAFFSDILESPEGVAIDWTSRNVYYADSARDEIGVLSLDGKYQKSLLNEGLHNPRAVAIDIQNKHLYYTDWHRAHPVIGRMDLDGKNQKQFVNTDIHLPNGLVILHQRRELCWVDAGAHTLCCIGLDGRGRRTVFADLQYPFGLTALNEQRFYWTDWKDNRVHSVSVYGEAYESFPISFGGSGKAYGILSVPKMCTGAPTACSLNNGGCSYLCLPSSEGVHCACPDNKKGLAGC